MSPLYKQSPCSNSVGVAGPISSESADFHAAEWLRALNLRERLSVGAVDTTVNGAMINSDAAVHGRSRLQRWQAEPQFAAPGVFAQKLKIEGTSEAELEQLLGESAQRLQERVQATPDWLEDLAEAFEGFAAGESADDNLDFLALVEPLIAQGRGRLKAGLTALLEQYTEAPFHAAETETVFVEMLYSGLPELLERTLVLELNVARLQNHLEGDTTEERYQSFLRRLRRRETAIPLLQEYPVLARQVVTCIRHWVESGLEFVRRLCEDVDMIRATFAGGRNLGKLVDVVGGIGDGHGGGRSVLIAKFDSGLSVVYKPKSVAVVAHFQELLTWLNDRGAEPALKTIAVVERETHGWIEFVKQQGCSSDGEIERFYRRQGQFLALFYALEATDFHAENLIACGEHPVPIDLEALFHPRTESQAFSGVDHLATERNSQSVLRVGLLPEFVWASGESAGVDISGFGNVDGKTSPFGVPDWDRSGTDEMCLVRRPVVMRGSQNRPTRGGADVEVLDYLPVIIDGFTAMYRLLESRRDELLASTGPLARFHNDEVRAVLRPTRSYALLLQESFHPDVLRDALDRDRLFDRLYGRLSMESWLARVIPSELEDLSRGDIPIFATRPASRDLWDGMHRRISDFYTASGSELVERRLRGLDGDDLRRQVWYIRATFAALASDRGYVVAKPKTATPLVADRDCFVAEARRIGDHLTAEAIRDGGEATWVGLLNVRETQWSVGSLGLDLYNGLPGVALFLAYLGDVTGDARYTATARAATAKVLRHLAVGQIRWVGAFEGLAGIVYALTHLGALWRDEDLTRAADRAVESLLPLIDEDVQLDVIGGAAGCLGAMLAHHQTTGSPTALGAAVRSGERLLVTASSCETGIGWIVPQMSLQPLSGFSHGGSGASWALMNLAAQTHDERFHRAGLASVEYERTLFSARLGNWLDVRTWVLDKQAVAPPTEQHAGAWCHGAPGIGLSRLLGLPHFDTAEVRNEIDVALHTTLSLGFGGTPTLCHGNLGNIDILLEAASILKSDLWRAEARRCAEVALAGIASGDWACAAPLGVTSPGLMTGLAGIGYGLLRIADPARIPSVLSLAAPVSAST